MRGIDKPTIDDDPFLALKKARSGQVKDPRVLEKPCKGVMEIPMPTIHTDPNLKGPIQIDEQWAKKQDTKNKKAKSKDKEKTRRKYEAEVIRLITTRDRLRRVLNKLNPMKKKDSKKIAKINIALRSIEYDLNEIEKEMGVKVDNIETGSKVKRFFNNVKETIKSGWKKVKKFFRRNMDTIGSILTVAASIIGALCTRRLTISAA